MAKCPACRGRGRIKLYEYRESNHVGFNECVGKETCSECGGRGYIPFWTPAERAGLRAMGRLSLSCIDGSYTHREPMQCVIRAYIKSARAAKEPR